MVASHRIVFISHFAMNACRQSYLWDHGDDIKGVMDVRAIPL